MTYTPTPGMADAPVEPPYDTIREALREMIYEITHLSREEEDGGHWCKISKTTLEHARIALAAVPVPNLCAKIFDHKWLDPVCVEKGCQSLVLALRGEVDGRCARRAAE